MASDRVFGLFILMVALAYVASAFQIQTSFMADPVGSKTFPVLIGAVAAVCGGVMVLRPDPEPEWPGPRTIGALTISVLVMVLFALALKPFGFLIPTAVTAAILSYQISTRPLPAVLVGLGLSAGLFLLFKHVLGLGLVPFPRGWLG